MHQYIKSVLFCVFMLSLPCIVVGAADRQTEKPSFFKAFWMKDKSERNAELTRLIQAGMDVNRDITIGIADDYCEQIGAIAMQPLEMAVEQCDLHPFNEGDKEMVLILLRAGAKRDRTDGSGMTAEERARENGKVRTDYWVADLIRDFK